MLGQENRERDLLLTFRGTIHALLVSSKCESWRDPVREFLSRFESESTLQEHLVFLIHVVEQALQLKYKDPAELHFITLDGMVRPGVLDVDAWRQLMAAMGFILDEADAGSDILESSVFTHEMLPLPALNGYLTLVTSLQVLSFHQIREVMSLTDGDAELLMSTIHFIVSRRAIPHDFMEDLWWKKGRLLEDIGFRRARRDTSRPRFYYISGSRDLVTHPGPDDVTSEHTVTTEARTSEHVDDDRLGAVGQQRRPPDKGGPTAARTNLPELYAVILAMYGKVNDTVQETSV